MRGEYVSVAPLLSLSCIKAYTGGSSLGQCVCCFFGCCVLNLSAFRHTLILKMFSQASFLGSVCALLLLLRESGCQGEEVTSSTGG